MSFGIARIEPDDSAKLGGSLEDLVLQSQMLSQEIMRFPEIRVPSERRPKAFDRLGAAVQFPERLASREESARVMRAELAGAVVFAYRQGPSVLRRIDSAQLQPDFALLRV